MDPKDEKFGVEDERQWGKNLIDCYPFAQDLSL